MFADADSRDEPSECEVSVEASVQLLPPPQPLQAARGSPGLQQHLHGLQVLPSGVRTLLYNIKVRHILHLQFSALFITLLLYPLKQFKREKFAVNLLSIVLFA